MNHRTFDSRMAIGDRRSTFPGDSGGPVAETSALARERVAAFVVTYRRRGILEENVTALLQQTHALDAVVVLNNDPSDDLRALAALQSPTVQVLDLADNAGSAGGFAQGLYIARHCNYGWAWLLDDDSVPAPNALEELLKAFRRARDEGRPVGLLAPLQWSPRGPFGWAQWDDRVISVPASWRERTDPFPIDLAYWAGLLVSREVVERIGYPTVEFFRSYADYEYCLRARRAGLEVLAVPTSHLKHDPGLARPVVRLGRRSVRAGYNPLRHYYDARNAAFTAWHSLRSPRAVLFHILRQSRLVLGEMVYESHKWERVRLRLRGTLDGFRGRLGRRRDLE